MWEYGRGEAGAAFQFTRVVESTVDDQLFDMSVENVGYYHGRRVMTEHVFVMFGHGGRDGV